jgi:hypothetical protein
MFVRYTARRTENGSAAEHVRRTRSAKERAMRNRSVARFRGDVQPAGTHVWVSNMGMRHAPRIVFLQLTAIVVDDYDASIAFFIDALGFEADSPSLTNAGNPKRWVGR